MATIELSHAHSLPVDEALVRVRKLLEEWKAKNPDMIQTISWDEDGQAATAKGKGFSARFIVGASNARIEVDLSLMLRPFKKQVRTRLQNKLEQALA